MQSSSASLNRDAIDFFSRKRPRPFGAISVLKAISAELSRQLGVEQMRSLLYAVGSTFAAGHPLEGVVRLGDLELAARELLASNDWGWLRIDQDEHYVDFIHGDSPLAAWFGEENLEWSPALFEGVYAGWVSQLGADKHLQVRQIKFDGASDCELRFRLAHESRFKE